MAIIFPESPAALDQAMVLESLARLDHPEQSIVRESCPKPNRSSYIPSLDGLRAIAFLLVFAAHSGLDKLIPGGFGVTVFFFLSGYLITTLLRSEVERNGHISLRKFYLRRCRRILPPLYVTLAVAYLLAAVHLVRGQGTLSGALSAVFYYYNYLELSSAVRALPTGLNVLWSLTIEEHFYFVFPLLYTIAVRNSVTRRALILTMAALCGAALAWRTVLVFALHSQTTRLPMWTYSASDARFDAILWGCLLAISINPVHGDLLHHRWLNAHKGIAACCGVMMILASLLFRDPQFRETLRYTIQSLALAPIFIYCVSSYDHWTVRWLEWTPLREIGKLSYAMYLLHFLVLCAISVGWPGGHIARAILAFVITGGYAMFMRRFVEDPIRRWAI